MKTNPLPGDRTSRLIVALVVGAIALALVLLVAALAADADDDHASTPKRCPGQVAGVVDPVTCVPYGGMPAGEAADHRVAVPDGAGPYRSSR
ncbi:hypothetical protein [Streptomyces sp. NPDC014006]|uniref:hypothetical protein n=1 Tax=Streptomyces sp. NPDC014006 TaxID=3364870 RepID=UPI0036FD5E44